VRDGAGQGARGRRVIGLQRASAVAGARTTVTTLWQVDDAGTQALMVEFYRNLWQKKLGKLEALRQAQLAMLAGKLHVPDEYRGGGKERRLSPFYWAAFTLAGGWR
jgi:CHAT domain-containing protein